MKKVEVSIDRRLLQFRPHSLRCVRSQDYSQLSHLPPRSLVRFIAFKESKMITDLLFLAVSIGGVRVVPPALQGKSDADPLPLDLEGTNTDSENIASTIQIVDQKAGAIDDTPPNQPVAETVVTAVDGELTDAGTGGIALLSSMKRPTVSITPETAKRDLEERVGAYDLVFSGTGTGRNDRDGSIQGTAYLTYTVVPNNTYSVGPCLEFCDRVKECGKQF